mmetsp:Transcript_131560/g.294386  ORF Transcript_131560/g.294386 Transcript_131560/m.294386 type:complete len:234 (-) Transcript_131560:73-774(-)
MPLYCNSNAITTVLTRMRRAAVSSNSLLCTKRSHLVCWTSPTVEPDLRLNADPLRDNASCSMSGSDAFCSACLGASPSCARAGVSFWSSGKGSMTTSCAGCGGGFCDAHMPSITPGRGGGGPRGLRTSDGAGKPCGSTMAGADARLETQSGSPVSAWKDKAPTPGLEPLVTGSRIILRRDLFSSSRRSFSVERAACSDTKTSSSICARFRNSPANRLLMEARSTQEACASRAE